VPQTALISLLQRTARAKLSYSFVRPITSVVFGVRVIKLLFFLQKMVINKNFIACYALPGCEKHYPVYFRNFI